jgi:hypothetical protein
VNVIGPLLAVFLFVGFALFLYWYNHPAVRLKRRIKEGLEREKQAQEELDAAFQKAKADMEQVARDWEQP